MLTSISRRQDKTLVQTHSNFWYRVRTILQIPGLTGELLQIAICWERKNYLFIENMLTCTFLMQQWVTYIKVHMISTNLS